MSKVNHEFSQSFEALALAINAYASASNAWDTFWQHVIGWWNADIYPSNKELIKFLSTVQKEDGTPRWGKSSLPVYASNILKWARSTAHNSKGEALGPQNPGSIKRLMSEHPKGHEKDARGSYERKGKKTNEGAAAKDDTKKPTSLADILQALRGMRAGLPKIPGGNTIAVLNAWEELQATIANAIQERKADDKTPATDD